eukprot:CAMPEP_0119372950 /NCGR_PEP_ID=MMETSP1334-20130426/23487_1 /TAXON_ID=127549 /ORGANISM="Calcidiscus leptoporus, Strain RCC1130" /LENGTH=121 /DNA_ID=CAMNT_0007390583 /DNA_START=35 /DNA_END=395 /DNA_ORIENTATION=+
MAHDIFAISAIDEIDTHVLIYSVRGRVAIPVPTAYLKRGMGRAPRLARWSAYWPAGLQACKASPYPTSHAAPIHASLVSTQDAATQGQRTLRASSRAARRRARDKYCVAALMDCAPPLPPP